MCGICGIALREGIVNERRISAMTSVLRHRGPDDSGIFIDKNIGFGHRRLSIIDLQGGHQPMSNEDDTIWIAYNGEIYNHLEIRKKLVDLGHQYRTRSDTETLLHLYEEKGVESVEEFRGMFAYSLWDSQSKKLILVRDRLGIKPLYYHFEDGNLIWGSEIKAILESGYVKPRLRMQSLPDYLANHYTSGEETLFEGIKRLLPGYLLIWQDGKIKTYPYWDVNLHRVDNSASEHDLINEFSDLFEHSVRLRLMSDVPLGMFLSGGIDSSAIAALMSKMVDQPIKTFSVAFEESEANELYYARLVAKKYRTDHREIIITPDSFFSELPSLIWHEDEPIAFPSSVPLYFVSKLASEQVKVVLTGEGSDELLAGYQKYWKTLWNVRLGGLYAEALPKYVREKVKDIIDRLVPHPLIKRKLIRTFLYLNPEIESIYFDNFSVFSRQAIGDLLGPKTQATINDLDPYKVNMYYLNRNGADNLLEKILYTDIKTYLHELLMKQDQMSMAASIESRVPFLDHMLVEFIAKLPTRYKLRGWTTKYILRKSMQDILPKEILQRRKMGFPVPIRRWFKEGTFQALHDYLLGARTLARGLFNAEYVRHLLNSHISGHQDHSERLWSLLNLEMWHRIFIDGEEIGK